MKIYLKTVASITISLLLAGCDAPPMKHYDPPGASNWKPTGAPNVVSDEGLSANHAAFRTLHSTTYNADEVWLAYAPVFEQGWVAETHLFVPEGPTFDDQGNLYFSPILPPEAVLLVSLDPKDGHRRWAINGKRTGSGGAPLILQNSDNPSKQIVYSGSYEYIMAVDTDGNIVWDKPTGLTASSTSTLGTHNYGVNYLRQQDALVSITGDGHLIAVDRASGERLATPFQLPGAPAKNSGGMNLPSWVKQRADKLLAPLFDASLSSTGSLFDNLAQALLGGGAPVSNYFSIDPNTGTLWIASTAPDAADGKIDGIAAYGSLYAFQLKKSAAGFAFEEQCHAYFPGGSASTPTLSADGKRAYIGDSHSALLAIDQQCATRWSVDVGSQIVGSLAVSQDNNEIYAATGSSVIKVIDQGDHGSISWRAKMDMFQTSGLQTTGNLNLAGVGANGVVIHVGGGFKVQGQMLPLSVGVALLDRDTGAARYAAQGLEETVSVMSSNMDGALYLGHSPFRRAIAYALTGRSTPLLGGIGQYRPLRPDLLLREAACAARNRLQNQLTGTFSALEQRRNQTQLTLLIEEATTAWTKAVLTDSKLNPLGGLLDQAKNSIENDKASDADVPLTQVCGAF